MSKPVRQPSSKKSSSPGVVLAVVVGIAAFAFWQMGGWLGRSQSSETTSVRILSGSMAPALHGPAWRIGCEYCEESFLFNAVSEAAISGGDQHPDFAVHCPNCGQAQSSAAKEAAELVEQQVDIVPVSSTKEIKRYDIVAIKEADSDRFAVKRILGLPGESIRLRDGDVFANGEMLRKDLPQLQPVAIPVHRHQVTDPSRPEVTRTQRWQSAIISEWRPDVNGFLWQSPDATQSTIEGVVDWLQYCHSPALPLPFLPGTPGPIKDNYGYNQRLSRSLNDTADFFIRFQFSPGDCGAIWLKLNHSDQSFTCRVSPTEATLVTQANADPLTFPMPAMSNQSEAASRFVELVWGHWDGQIVLVADGNEIFRHVVGDSSDSSPGGFTGHARPLAIGIEPAPPREKVSQIEQGPDARTPSAVAKIRSLEIYRDVYYTNPPQATGSDTEWQTRLDTGDYLLLGDNSPVSVDSRVDLDAGRQLKKRLLGRVTNPRTVRATADTAQQSDRQDP